MASTPTKASLAAGPSIAVPLVTTGMTALDEFLGGGIPRGSLVVLLAPPGAGAEVFAKQFAAGAASPTPGENIFVSTEESAPDVELGIRGFGFPGRPRVVSIADRYSAGLLAIQRERMKAAGQSAIDRALRADASSLLTRERENNEPLLWELLAPFAGTTTDARVTVYSIDFFISLFDADRIINLVTAAKVAASHAGGVLFLVLTRGAHAASVEHRFEMLADCLLELEVVRRATTFEKYLHIKRLKNRFIGLGLAPFRITPRGFEFDNLDRIL